MQKASTSITLLLNQVMGVYFLPHPVTKVNYYHPDMLGSWSIKAVLPTIAPASVRKQPIDAPLSIYGWSIRSRDQ